MDLQAELRGIFDEDRVLTRYIDLIAYANDASVYRLVPRAVVQPTSVPDVQALFRFSHEHRIPLTFRAAGTSLSGQAVGEGILVDVSRCWRRIEVLDGGRKVRVEPGVIGGVVNRHLQAFGSMIGPDPASINACMMGGILANNSSGMCCGVVNNAYHTLDSIIFVLPNGLVISTSEEDAEERLARGAPELAEGLSKLKDRIEANKTLKDRIRAKYRMKNTNGYSLNAFLDFNRPVDILGHLMIGSEGTLGFIAEAVLKTVPDHPVKYTGLLFFPDVAAACTAIVPLRDSGARALELMDRASLRAIESQTGVPAEIRELPEGAAALLVEYQCDTESELEESKRACEKLLPGLSLVSEPIFTRDPDRQATLWRVRKGLIPSVGAMRRRGTSFIIEDVVFPVETLSRGVGELQSLFSEYHYDDAIVFGHAKDGNLHFVLTQAFQNPADVERYDQFMRSLVVLVAHRHGGALKAEHGTGRNMAPFVEAEWGGDAFGVMKTLKTLVDPEGLLNPGVILNEDPRAHLTHLKSLPAVEPEVDQCIECGFCERMCPSRDLTLTPRQRIVVRREMSRLREMDTESPLLRELEADYVYSGVKTCAVDGMCATACPVGIDTGKLTKRLRCRSHSKLAHRIALGLVNRFAMVERGTRLALRSGHGVRVLLGRRGMAALRRITRGTLGGYVQALDSGLPRAAAGSLPRTFGSGARAVYFPSCVSRVFGATPDHPEALPLARALTEVAARAGLPVWIPGKVPGHCCGMPFSSKGYDRAYRGAMNRTVRSLWEWSRQGQLPVVVDSSPCAHTLKQAGPDLDDSSRAFFDRLKILDGIEFAHSYLLPRLKPARKRGSVVLHPVCSVVEMNLTDMLRAIVESSSGTVKIPLSAGCCGFAGDRGFFLPELTEVATRAEAIEVNARSYDGYYSSSRTCEIGLSRATGKPYRSFWYLLEEATRGK